MAMIAKLLASGGAVAAIGAATIGMTPVAMASAGRAGIQVRPITWAPYAQGPKADDGSGTADDGSGTADKTNKWEAAQEFESEFQRQSEEQERSLRAEKEVDWELQQQLDELKFDLTSQAEQQAAEVRENLTMTGDLAKRRLDPEEALPAERDDGQSQGQSS
jgi:hypothetical protein